MAASELVPRVLEFLMDCLMVTRWTLGLSRRVDFRGLLLKSVVSKPCETTPDRDPMPVLSAGDKTVGLYARIFR